MGMNIDEGVLIYLVVGIKLQIFMHPHKFFTIFLTHTFFHNPLITKSRLSLKFFEKNEKINNIIAF